LSELWQAFGLTSSICELDANVGAFHVAELAQADSKILDDRFVRTRRPAPHHLFDIDAVGHQQVMLVVVDESFSAALAVDINADIRIALRNTPMTAGNALIGSPHPRGTKAPAAL
jgi:hypothetical protein